MNSYIFKKETWAYTLFFVCILLILTLLLPLSAGFPKNDFVVVLDYGNGPEKKFTGKLSGGISAWDVLQQASANSIIKLEAAPDFYPKNIDSWENGRWGKNWTLYINGNKVSQEPINVSINNGDTVLWRFE
ncbi:MAG: DUF4430 domain-containing protein [Patescibacteria group bacterium]